MNNINVKELNLEELRQIDGGVDEDAYKIGYSAGQVVGKMVKNWLTLTGICRLFAII